MSRSTQARSFNIDNAKLEQVGPWDINQTHQVDCLLALSQMPDDCVDLIVTSPPYWGQRGTKGLGLEADPRVYIKNLVEIISDALRCLKPNGTLWLNIGDSYNTPINWCEDDSYSYSTLGKKRSGLNRSNSAYTKKRGRRRAFIDKSVGWLQYGNLLAIPLRVVIALTERGFLYRGEVIWKKSRPMPEGRCRRPHRHHEGIYILAKYEQHNFQIKPPVPSVWELTQTPNKTAHCSTFPFDLPFRCIEAGGIEGVGLVLDPFMGSGTTAEAARKLGHNFIGFELNGENCELANKRLKQQVK